MNRVKKIILGLFLIAVGFWGGNSWRSIQYRDACLDSGGAVDAATGGICRHSPAAQP